MIKNLLFCFFLLNVAIVYGQVSKNIDVNSNFQEAYVLIKNNSSAIDLSPPQLDNIQITHSYQDAISQAIMVYAQRTYDDIPIYNAIYVMAFKNGKINFLNG